MSLDATRELTDAFEALDGRRPRLLLASMGACEAPPLRVYAAAFADAGFDIDVAPAHATAADMAKMAAENDVHLIGLCSSENADAALIADLQAALAAQEREDISFFIRAQTHASIPELFFEPHTPIEANVNAVIRRLHELFA